MSTKTTGRRKIATARDYATVKFEPWPAPLGGHLVPRRETINRLGLMARLACSIVLKTRSELIGDCRKMSEEAALDLLDGLWKTEAAFKEMCGMLRTAQLRVLAAAHAVDAERRSSKRPSARAEGDDGRVAS